MTLPYGVQPLVVSRQMFGYLRGVGVPAEDLMVATPIRFDQGVAAERPWSLDDPMTHNFQGSPTSVTFAAPCPAGHDAVWRADRDPHGSAASRSAYQCPTCTTAAAVPAVPPVPTQPAPGGHR